MLHPLDCPFLAGFVRRLKLGLPMTISFGIQSMANKRSGCTRFELAISCVTGRRRLQALPTPYCGSTRLFILDRDPPNQRFRVREPLLPDYGRFIGVYVSKVASTISQTAHACGRCPMTTGKTCRVQSPSLGISCGCSIGRICACRHPRRPVQRQLRY